MGFVWTAGKTDWQFSNQEDPPSFIDGVKNMITERRERDGPAPPTWSDFTRQNREVGFGRTFSNLILFLHKIFTHKEEEEKVSSSSSFGYDSEHSDCSENEHFQTQKSSFRWAVSEI